MMKPGPEKNFSSGHTNLVGEPTVRLAKTGWPKIWQFILWLRVKWQNFENFQNFSKF